MSDKNQIENFKNLSSYLPLISTDKLKPSQFNVVLIFIKKISNVKTNINTTTQQTGIRCQA